MSANASVHCPLLGHPARFLPSGDGSRGKANYDCTVCGRFSLTERLWRLLHTYPERLRRAVSLYVQAQPPERGAVTLDVENFRTIGEDYLQKF